MGRFDALTQREDQNKQDTPLPAVPSPTQKALPTTNANSHGDTAEKPEIMISRNHESVSRTNTLKDKPVKYSTLLDAALIKKIKLAAAEKEIKDYEVIEQALTEYFAKHK